jgi:hypothetical protein
MDVTRPSGISNYDAFVAKLTPDGSGVAYTTYLGGFGVDSGAGIAVDSAGAAYIIGYTESFDFPTQRALRGSLSGPGDAFVAKLQPSGELFYSTYLGGSGYDSGKGIAVDGAGAAIVTGTTGSLDFPTQGSFQASLRGGSDAFIAKLGPNGRSLLFSTYLGGSSDESGRGITVDSTGAILVIGRTASTDFPTKNPFQGVYRGNWDAFVALIYATYLGGSGDEDVYGVAVDSSGAAYLTGNTASSDFPTKNALQPSKNGAPGDHDAFVAKITSDGASLVYSTFLGGSSSDYGMGIAVDSTGAAHVAGYTWSPDFPIQNALAARYLGNGDPFVAKLKPDGSALVYSTYLLGTALQDAAAAIAVDAAGAAYVTGALGGGPTPFVAKLQAQPTTKVGVFSGAAWYLDVNGNGIYEPGTDRSFFLGWPGAVPIQGDWNGDGRTEAGVYANGFWFLDYDGNGVWDGGVRDELVGWGWAGATPVVGDWNGDGRTKIGVYSNGFWFLDYNGDFLWDGGVVDKAVGWGWAGVTPIVGDWNGNGKTKIGVYLNGIWVLDYDGNYSWDGGVADKAVGWGWPGATPVVGDWNGDGKTKIGVYAGGYWYLDYDGNYLWEYPAKDRIWALGWTGTTPVIGDWSGDGKEKAGAFINGYWYLDYNGNGAWDGSGTDRIYAFGQAGDTPVVGRW